MSLNGAEKRWLVAKPTMTTWMTIRKMKSLQERKGIRIDQASIAGRERQTNRKEAS